LETKFVVPGAPAFRPGQAQRREITKFPIWFSGCLCVWFVDPSVHLAQSQKANICVECVGKDLHISTLGYEQH